MQAKGRLRVVIDANVIVSGLIAVRGIPGRILDSWHERHFEVVTSYELVNELAEALARVAHRHSIGDTDIRRMVDRLSRIAGEGMPLADLPLHSRDPKDDPVLACAFGAGADYIVTGDKDLLVLEGEPACGRLRIVTPAEFLELLATR